ncbi:hypothetical protein A628_00177 [Salmonella enterica subsp. enterica serovar Cubana str. 76814]|uniref:Uncharacterized protein n=1 Tax=Salmonella enterica subsp. enterica serovar Cubana str. 76814 TaxID=1192560 RepID=V7IWU2_SALET|nr:hypothetical protein A628_00177 [Salmonella enterica subsp. enterica serovar Cubana str. 76814]
MPDISQQELSPNPISPVGLFFAKSVVTRNKSGCRSDQTALRC